MLRAPEPSGLGRSWPPAAPLSHSQSFQPSLLSTVATPSFQDLQIPSLLGPSLSGAVPGAQAFVSGRADPDPAPISPTGPATHRKQAPAEFAVQKGINQELLAASATEDEGCALQARRAECVRSFEPCLSHFVMWAEPPFDVGPRRCLQVCGPDERREPVDGLPSHRPRLSAL